MTKFSSDIYQSKYRENSIVEADSLKTIDMRVANFSIDASLKASNEYKDAFEGGSHGTLPDLRAADISNMSIKVSPVVYKFLTKKALK